MCTFNKNEKHTLLYSFYPFGRHSVYSTMEIRIIVDFILRWTSIKFMNMWGRFMTSGSSDLVPYRKRIVYKTFFLKIELVLDVKNLHSTWYQSEVNII